MNFVDLQPRSPLPLLHVALLRLHACTEATSLRAALESARVDLRAAHLTPDELVTALAILNAAADQTRERILAEARAHTESSRAHAETSRARSEREAFLAKVTHELRTPLHGILGFAELCRRDGVGARVGEHLRHIEQSAAQMRDIVEHLSEFLRDDVVPGEAKHTDVHGLLRTVLDAHREAAARKGISLAGAVAPSTPDVRVDGVALQKLLGHLVSNAVKFTDRGGVAVSVSVVAREAAQARLRFDVTDTGVGVAPSQLARIFDPFHQSSAFETRPREGVGLGLALASRLASALGATLAADSMAGVGSEFSVELTAEVTREPSTPAVTPATPTGPMRVLLAEDNPVNQLLAVALLQRDGHEVRVVSNGRAAVDAVRDGAVDLVLMDLQMPEMDGYEATQRIRALDEAHGRHTPIIAMTAHGGGSDRRRCLAVGMDAFVSKPIDWPTLRRSMERERVRAGSVPPRGCASVPPPASAPFDLRSLRERVGDRHELLVRVVDAFREQYPAQLSSLRDAVGRRSAVEVRQLAHRLVGTLTCFSATTAVDEARAVERLAAAGALDDAALRLDPLDDAVRTLDRALGDVVRVGFDSAQEPAS